MSGARTPKASEISAALATLGVYAATTSEHELEEQAEQAGGEDVLAAALANALYGAAIGVGMLAEGRMQERRGQNNASSRSPAGKRLWRRALKGPGLLGPCTGRRPYRLAAAGAERSRDRAARPGSSRGFLGTRVAPSVDVPRRAWRRARRGGERLSDDSED